MGFNIIVGGTIFGSKKAETLDLYCRKAPL